MHADIKGALANINKSSKFFYHRGKLISKENVIKVLNYALKKGYKNTSELQDSEIDLLIQTPSV